MIPAKGIPAKGIPVRKIESVVKPVAPVVETVAEVPVVKKTVKKKLFGKE